MVGRQHGLLLLALQLGGLSLSSARGLPNKAQPADSAGAQALSQPLKTFGGGTVANGTVASGKVLTLLEEGNGPPQPHPAFTEVKPHGTVQTSPRPNLTSIPEVRHYKAAGGGYEKHSPLYAKQQEWKSIVERLGIKEKLAIDMAEAAPIPISMRCIINLMCQFFAVYTGLFILQTLNRLRFIKREREEKWLIALADTVFFVPMICVLLLTAHMRAAQLSQGQAESHGLPQWWVKSAMVTCTWSILILTILILTFTALYGGRSVSESGEVWEVASKRMAPGSMRRIMQACKSIVMFSIYASFTAVCIGLCIMHAPPGLWSKDAVPGFNPAMLCIVFLAVTYFAVHLASTLGKVANELGILGQTMRFGNAQAPLKNAITAVTSAPMLCILFIAVWMRASQFDLIGKTMPHWVSAFFYICTTCVLLQTLLAILAGALGLQESSEGRHMVPTGGLTADLEVKIIEAARFVLMACFYIGVAAIIIGICAIKPMQSTGGMMPPSLLCVILLMSLYFMVYLAMWVLLTVQRYRAASLGLHGDSIMPTLELFVGSWAKEAVAFCPMFCILFLGALVRTVQLKGSLDESYHPYRFFEYIATASILLLALARIDVVLPRATYAITTACLVFQYVCLAVLDLSAIGGMVMLFAMTP